MNRLTWLLACALALLAPGFTACAQQDIPIVTKAGQTIPTLGLRRDGSTVLARIKTADGSIGEVGYDVSTIAKIDFPEAPQIKAATDLLDQGRADEAYKQLVPVTAYYAPFRDVPGNWWAPLAILQVDALNRLGRDAEAESIVADLTRLGLASPEMLRSVKIRQGVALERKAVTPSDHRKVLEFLQPIVTDATAMPTEVAEGWLSLGAAHLALREYKPALLAYLHIPLYTPERANLMSPALLGSAVAFIGIDDKERARTALKTLVDKYPGAPEITEAKNRLQRLNSDLSGAKPAS